MNTDKTNSAFYPCSSVLSVVKLSFLGGFFVSVSQGAVMDSRHRVVIVGGGFGGLEAALIDHRSEP